MRAGKLRHKIEIQSYDKKQSQTTGQITKSWEEKCKVCCNFTFVSGNEFIQSDAKQEKILARAVIRFKDDIEETMRVIFKNKKYNISAVLADNRSGNQYLTLMLSGLINDG